MTYWKNVVKDIMEKLFENTGNNFYMNIVIKQKKHEKCNTIFLFHIDFNHCDWRSILPERSMWYAGSLLKELHVGVATEKPTSTSCSNNADSTKGISCLWSPRQVLRGITVVGRVCATVRGLFVVGTLGNQAFHLHMNEHPTSTHRLRSN